MQNIYKSCDLHCASRWNNVITNHDVLFFTGVYVMLTYSHNVTVNPENFARILFWQIGLKDIFVTQKIRK